MSLPDSCEGCPIKCCVDEDGADPVTAEERYFYESEDAYTWRKLTRVDV